MSPTRKAARKKTAKKKTSRARPAAAKPPFGARKPLTAVELKLIAREGDGFGFFGHAIRSRDSFLDDLVPLAVDSGFVGAVNAIGMHPLLVGVYGNCRRSRHHADALMDEVIGQSPATAHRRAFEFYLQAIPAALEECGAEEIDAALHDWRRKFAAAGIAHLSERK